MESFQSFGEFLSYKTLKAFQCKYCSKTQLGRCKSFFDPFSKLTKMFRKTYSISKKEMKRKKNAYLRNGTWSAIDEVLIMAT